MRPARTTCVLTCTMCVRHDAIFWYIVFFLRSIEKNLLIGKEVHYNVTFPYKYTRPRMQKRILFMLNACLPLLGSDSLFLRRRANGLIVCSTDVSIDNAKDAKTYLFNFHHYLFVIFYLFFL